MFSSRILRTFISRTALVLGLVLVAGLVVPSTAVAGTLTIESAISNLVVLNVKMNSATENVYAGSIVPTSLDGGSLGWMYCVDFSRNIYVPGSYSVAETNDGTIHGASVSNAGQVAWLLSTYADTASKNTATSAALQAAIWKVIYGSAFDLLTTGSIYTQYLAYYNSINGQTASISEYTWLSPSQNGTPLQGQVTKIPHSASAQVPEPSLMVMLGIGIGMVCLGARKTK